MKFYLGALLLLYASIGSCQSKESKIIELRILTDTVKTISGDNDIKIEYSIKNLSDSNLILYRTTDKIIHFPSSRIELLCDQDKTGAGMVFVLFDEDLKWRSARHRIISDHSLPMTMERSDSAMRAANAESLRATLTLKKNEVRIFNQRIDINSINLPKGRYLIKLIYYSGKKISYFVSQDQQTIDRKANKANVYQGCVTSEKVFLVVD